MSYNQKKFLDSDGLVHLLRILDNYPTNDILGTVINSIDQAISEKYTKPASGIPASDLASGVVPVQDVQIAGTSILSNGIANFPMITSISPGIPKVDQYSAYGINVRNDGTLQVVTASSAQIKTGSAGNDRRPITPSNQDIATFYGLAKAAGHDEKDSVEPLGTYTDGAKAAIQHMLGTDTNLAPYEADTFSDTDYAVGELFMLNGKLHQATAAIATGDTLEIGVNCQVVNAAQVFAHDVQVNGTSILNNGVANVPVGDNNAYGVFKAGGYGVYPYYGFLRLEAASETQIKNGSESTKSIVPQNQHIAAFYGLAKAAGANMASLSNITVGTYPDAQKAAIQKMLGITSLLAPDETSKIASKAYSINDIFITDGKLYKASEAIAKDAAIAPEVNCTETKASEVFVKNTDIATTTTAGIVKVGNGLGITQADGLYVAFANNDQIKAGTNGSLVPAVNRTHVVSFYGLAKAAGDSTQASSENAIGTYTDNAKTAIRSMIGAGTPLDVQVNGTSIVANGVANIPMAGPSTLGTVIVGSQGGLYLNPNSGVLQVNYAAASIVKAGVNNYQPITPGFQHNSTFYGLAKAAGVDMASSSNAVGTYTSEAKAAIQSMLGITQTITVTVQTQDNVTVTGQTVYLREDDANGPIYAQASYEGQPVSFAVPTGFHYHVSVTDNLAHHFNPTTATGIITNTNISVTLQYSDFSTIHTAADIKAALNADIDLTDLVGEQITCTRDNATLTWDVVDYDATNKTIMLLLHDAFGSANMVFEPGQALMWCENGLAAGNYKFTVGTTVYYFTLTQAIPAGGQLVASDAGTFSTYASQSATATTETGTVSTTEISGATDLGTAGSGLLNHNSRVRYGSNNCAESALLWWLNSDAAANTQRTPVTKFSRAYSYSVPGFLYNLDQDFIACLDDVEWKCSTNNVYECPQSLGGYTTGTGRAYTITKKIGLASEMEIFGSYGGNSDGSTIFDLYNGASEDDRKKYRGTTAQTWWLRSPHWSYADLERNVTSSGGAVTNYANVSYAVVPACRISKDQEET